MHQHQLKRLSHQHDYAVQNNKGERNTLIVMIITAVTMVIEIIAGTLSGSMALLADGWHMATHVAAFSITLFAYRFARKHANNPYFSFGTGKVNALGGFASAVALSVVSLMMFVESFHRLMSPEAISFDEAIAVACIGLLVNVLGAWLLKDDHHHDHGHTHHHDHNHCHNHHHDHNLHAAYMHVLADALTSLLAILALFAGKYAGLNWLDPIMGIVGAIIITVWAVRLVKQTSPILLDASIEDKTKAEIVKAIESDQDNKVADLHIWKLGANDFAAIITLVTEHPQSVEHYKSLLVDFKQLSHVTVEVNQCFDSCSQS